MQSALSLYMGSEAAKTIGSRGWQSAPLSTLIGASGGPKWLILSELDKVLAETLLLGRDEPMTLLGSSIGTWRHACLSLNDSGAAISRLQQAYLYQEYSCARPSPIEVSEVAEQMLRRALGPEGARQIAAHPTLHNAIVTARAKGIARGESGWKLGVSMATATLGNAVSRKALGLLFDRVTFCHSELSSMPFTNGFNTQLTLLDELNLIPALKASGAIPFLMKCEPTIPGASGGPFWDGGIIDYHFTLKANQTPGLVLYPHFRDRLTPGWFDKMLRWRTPKRSVIDQLVLMCPSDAFLAQLPHGKIPDRGDFRVMSPADRVAYWETCVRESGRLAEAFYNLISGDDPLRGVTVL
jgi:hypothetical protein